MVHSISWKLWGALLLVVLLSVGLMAYLANLTTGRVFSQYLSGGMGQGMMGRGYMGGMMLGAAEEAFLSRINFSLIISGLIATAVALILGFILTRQITRPVFYLSNGAKQIAQGNLNYRVRVNSRDELGKLAESFNAMAVSLDNGEQERRRIVADIAHELRTPLTVIDGTVDAIIDGVFKPDKERLGSIKEQTQLLNRLVSDLRDISLAESGQLKLELVPTDIADLLRRKLAQMEVKAREKNVELKLNVSGNVPKIKIDAARIEQVISNLVTNAIRHTPGGGNITVSIKPHNDQKASVLISVADTGEGIPPEHLPHVFDRFYRVEESRSREEGGAGLGLAIVKHLVLAHGGKVWAESEVGKGSTFYVAL